jgi:hypothetical protein
MSAANAGRRIKSVEYFAFALERAIAHRRREGEGLELDNKVAALRGLLSDAADGEPLELELDPGGFSWKGRPIEPVEPGPGWRVELFLHGVRGLRFEAEASREDLEALVRVAGADLPRGEDRVSFSLYFRLGGVSLACAPAGGPRLAARGDGVCLEARPPTAAKTLSADKLEGLLVERGVGAVKAPEGRARAFREALRRQRDPRRFLQIALASGQPRPEPLLVAFESCVLRGDTSRLSALYDAVGRTRVPAAAPLRRALARPEHLRAVAPLVDRDPATLVPALRALTRHDGAGLVATLERLSNPEARTLVIDAAQAAGVELVPYYRRLLSSEDPEQVLAAVAELDSMDGLDATLALARGLQCVHEKARRAALEALVGRWDARLRTPVGRALGDSNRETRLLALRILAHSGDRRVGGFIAQAVQSPDFGERDSEERRAFYRALAGFENQKVTAIFEKLLVAPGVVRRSLVEDQLIAIDGLKEEGGPQSIALLERAAGRWYHPKPVKAALASALSAIKG